MGFAREMSDTLRCGLSCRTVLSLSRFRTALVVAAAAHAGITALVSLRVPVSVTVPLATSRTELQIELDDRGASAPRSLVARNDLVSVTEAQHLTRSRRSSEAARPATAPSAAPTLADVDAQPRAQQGAEWTATGANGGPLAATPNPGVDSGIDLGLSGELFRPRLNDANPGSGSRVDATSLSRRLNESLAAKDVIERGHARGNVMISALSAAVRQAGPVDDGSAMIRVTFNASGELSAVELLKGGANDWAAVIQSFRVRARGKRLSLPRGAAGLRVTYDVKSKLQLPSGAAADSGPMRLKRPSLLPNGLTLRGDFDPTDLSGKRSRIVSARVVAEEVL